MLNKPHEQNMLDSNKLVLTSSSESDELLEESELDEEEEDEDNLTKHNKKWSLWDAAFCLANSQKSIQTLPLKFLHLWSIINGILLPRSWSYTDFLK